MYGPTETLIEYDIAGPEREGLTDPQVGIGRPIPNVQVYVLDRHMQTVPSGS